MQSQQSVAQLLAGMSGMQSESNGHANASGLDQAQLLTLLKNIPNVFNQKNGSDGQRDSTSAERQLGYEHNAQAGMSRHIEDDYNDDGDDGEGSGRDSPKTGAKRKRKNEHGTEEWARQRKDNHKEVERRRRGNINEGINELGRIVPNGAGEKAKGAILSRAVQYIHHLKDNEARNIEKWTLEKLLMDQAMSDLQAQLEEARQALQEECLKREALETELEALRATQPS